MMSRKIRRNKNGFKKQKDVFYINKILDEKNIEPSIFMDILERPMSPLSSPTSISSTDSECYDLEPLLSPSFSVFSPSPIPELIFSGKEILSPEILIHIINLNLNTSDVLISLNLYGYKISYNGVVIFNINIYDNVTEFFNLKGELHRQNGPARYCNGREEFGSFYINGNEISHLESDALNIK